MESSTKELMRFVNMMIDKNRSNYDANDLRDFTDHYLKAEYTADKISG